MLSCCFYEGFYENNVSIFNQALNETFNDDDQRSLLHFWLLGNMHPSFWKVSRNFQF